MALFGSLGIDFGRDAHHAGYVAGLGLGARHSAQACGHKEQPFPGFTVQAFGQQLLAGGIHHRDGGSVHDSLRADIHITSGRHLSVLAYAQGVETLPVVRLGVVGDNHSVGHDDPRRIFVAGEQPQRMAGVHHQRLLVAHCGQILHHQAVLGPVLENGSVSAVNDELVRMLGHAGVQVVLDHRHNGRGLPALGRILVDGPRIHRIGRPIAVHINAAIGLELFRELRRQLRVKRLGEVTQGVLERQYLFLRAQDVLPLGSVVDFFVVSFAFRQASAGDAGQYFFLKLCHSERNEESKVQYSGLRHPAPAAPVLPLL